VASLAWQWERALNREGSLDWIGSVWYGYVRIGTVTCGLGRRFREVIEYWGKTWSRVLARRLGWLYDMLLLLLRDFAFHEIALL